MEKENNQIPILNHLRILQKRKSEIENVFKKNNKDFLKHQVTSIIAQNKVLDNDEKEIQFFLGEIARISKELKIFDKKDQQDNLYLNEQILDLSQNNFDLRKQTVLIEQNIYQLQNKIGFS
jgi:hypothetical protein